MKNLKLFTCLVFFTWSVLNGQEMQHTGDQLPSDYIPALRFQENPGWSKNVVYVEAGYIFEVSTVSVNYERLFGLTKSGKTRWYWRGGLARDVKAKDRSGLARVRIGGLGGLTMIFEKKPFQYDISLGLFAGVRSKFSKTSFGYPLADVGFRFQKPGKNLVFKAKAGTSGLGIGIGHTFGKQRFPSLSIPSDKLSEPAKMSKHVVYLEAGSILFVSSASINYEGLISTSPSEKVHWYWRGGAGGAAIFYGAAGYGGLLGMTMLAGKNKNKFEMSFGFFAGVDFSGGSAEGAFALPLFDLGYRFQKPGQSFVFRAKVGAMGLGVSLGHAF